MISKILNISLVVSSLLLGLICFDYVIGLNSNFIELQRENLQLSGNVKQLTSLIQESNEVKATKIANCILTDINTLQNVQMNDLIEGESDTKIIFRLKDTNCGPCISAQIEMLKKLDSLGNVIIVSNLSNVRQLYLAIDENRLKTRIFQLEEGQIFEGDDKNKALIIYVNKSGDILKTYFLDEDSFCFLKFIVPAIASV
ncbi:hypothetical protein EYV94_11120 [Puteibacter caeruleilacunae]|nr:hypothetical protein EYV94_11120 [Puteibacter caeruleilacunae]